MRKKVVAKPERWIEIPVRVKVPEGMRNEDACELLIRIIDKATEWSHRGGFGPMFVDALTPDHWEVREVDS